MYAILPEKCSVVNLSPRGAILSNPLDPLSAFHDRFDNNISRDVYPGNSLPVDSGPWNELDGTIPRASRDDGAAQGDGEGRLAHPGEFDSERIVPRRCRSFGHRISAIYVAPYAGP